MVKKNVKIASIDPENTNYPLVDSSLDASVVTSRAADGVGTEKFESGVEIKRASVPPSVRSRNKPVVSDPFGLLETI